MYCVTHLQMFDDLRVRPEGGVAVAAVVGGNLCVKVRREVVVVPQD